MRDRGGGANLCEVAGRPEGKVRGVYAAGGEAEETSPDRERRVVVITGLSGAGKTGALKAFEDAGYFCVDNLPPALISAFVDAVEGREEGPEKLAVVADIRGRRYFGGGLEGVLNELRVRKRWESRLIFVEADEPTIVRRYKESRRPHPVARDGDVPSAIRAERRDLAPLRELADVVVDTSSLSPAELRGRFDALARSHAGRLAVSLVSFGFKNGAPLDVDMLLDVRFLPNPYYDPALRPLTGHDEPVRDAVLSSGDAREFLERTEGLLSFLVPRYLAEGKAYFTLGVGCTGGRHRSVAIVEELARRLSSCPRVDLFVRHRDLPRSDG